jgi:hypothetical protein
LSEDWFKAGNKVIIIANTSRHKFGIGTVVVLGAQHEEPVHAQYRMASFGPEGSWWVRMQDCEPLDERSLEDIVKELLG